MFSFLRSQPNRALGVDVGTSAIKIVELTKDNERLRTTNYGLITRVEPEEAQGVSRKFSQLSVSDLSGLIQKAVVAMDLKAAPTAMSVPVFSSFSTLIQLPIMPAEEVAQAVQFEARKAIPVPIDEVVMEWTILQRERDPKLPQSKPAWFKFLGMSKAASNSATSAKGTIGVMLAAVPREVLAKYVAVANGVGLPLAFVEVETFSLARALASQTPEPSLLVDIGARSTNFSIIEEGFVSLTHNVETAGHDLTRATARGLNVHLARAEERKQAQGLTGGAGESQIAQLMVSYLDLLVGEAERVLAIHERSGSKVDRIIFAGGSVRLPGLADYFASKLNRPVEIAKPFQNLLGPSELTNQFDELGPSFAVAVGLAEKVLVP
ncbi:pilus assembly protein PilM [Candidatus Parcubacteria bacterium]|nr:pilus assembly protein PilM [Candidatus Parcubacteria bacterium]